MVLTKAFFTKYDCLSVLRIARPYANVISESMEDKGWQGFHVLCNFYQGLLPERQAMVMAPPIKKVT